MSVPASVTTEAREIGGLRAKADRMRYTIAHLSRPALSLTASITLLLAISVGTAAAQTTSASAAQLDPFAKGQWRAEFSAQAALEAWNYNPSHEEIYGLIQGISYGLKDGLTLIARQKLMYVSQRRNDSRVLALTVGLRNRMWRRGRTSYFLQFDLGISDAAVASPPGGTRFNYVATGGGGAVISLNHRVATLLSLDVIHISNGGLAGPDRNPDIEAIGPSAGIIIGF